MMMNLTVKYALVILVCYPTFYRIRGRPTLGIEFRDMKAVVFNLARNTLEVGEVLIFRDV